MKKIALITGSTRGIGRQIGEDLWELDYDVYLNGRFPISDEKILGLKYIAADLSDINAIDKLNKQIGALDVLVLNVGITDRTSFGEIKIKEWNAVINTNLTNQFFLVQKLKDKIRPNGRIIFISSISGIIPDSTSISYGVSKAAINMLVLYLAKEFAPKHITVNAIAPGYIMTDWHQKKSKAQLKRIAKKCLANRLGTPEEVSKAVLAVIDNPFINGQVLRIDGGFGL